MTDPPPPHTCAPSSGRKGFHLAAVFVRIQDLDECEEESCEGGSCVNTLGSYYCSCPPPLVLDDTQRKCVNASHLTLGKTSPFAFGTPWPK